ncbi:oxidoreductase, partial [Pseudomonas sp. BGM005]|nr:oxidoreductase [Pseudomonas sp. BG5]
AAIVEPSASPFAVIGGSLIDLAPSWAKDAAIALFGTGDKIALITGIALVLAGVAALAGILESRRAGVGSTILAALGVLALVAAMIRPGAGPFAWLPGLVAGVAAVVALGLLMRVVHPEPYLRAEHEERRRFLLWTVGVAATGAVALVIGNAARGVTRSIEAVRETLRLPTAASRAPAVPAAAELDISGLAPVVTRNTDFYRIDTALIVPRIDPADWALRIHGMVDREVVISWDEL